MVTMKTRISGDKFATKRWLRARVRLYAKNAGIGREDMPRIEFGPIGGDARNSAGSKAEYVLASNTVKFDLNQTLCRHDGDDSAAHEIVHARWYGLAHGALFLRRVVALREGHRCGPPGSALPPAFR
jgi:hypothetical protein